MSGGVSWSGSRQHQRRRFRAVRRRVPSWGPYEHQEVLMAETPEPEVGETPEDEMKRKFREALERKRSQQSGTGGGAKGGDRFQDSRDARPDRREAVLQA